jgi:single-strand selective monofunctional uracil DNA glycosylase
MPRPKRPDPSGSSLPFSAPERRPPPASDHPGVAIARELSAALARLRFAAPVAHVYNPLDYARAPGELYIERYARPGIEALLLGMNPGPFGMVQTGVPFGEVEAARGFLGVAAPVERPEHEHPRRPIEGFACQRSEVSGRRVWGWAEQRFQSPERFFARFFVWNWCPLAFLEASGKNRTPDKLPSAEREPLEALCDQALARWIAYLAPARLIGFGKVAEAAFQRARVLDPRITQPIGSILHPSPANPAANRGWAAAAEAQLAALGVRF